MGRWLWALVLATTSEAHYGPQCRLKSESGCSGSQRYFDPTASAVTFWPAAWTGGASDAPNAALTAGDLVGGDGLADVLVGGYDGGVVLFVNAGSGDAPAFVETPWDYGAVNASSSASPWLADIFDDDGLLDLVVGERLSGTVRLYKNGGTAAAPDFSGGPTAIPAPRRDQPAGVREHGGGRGSEGCGRPHQNLWIPLRGLRAQARAASRHRRRRETFRDAPPL